jgi:cobalamin biosynthesis protein CobT
LRTAVAASEDPRRYRDAWQRRTVRTKPDAAVLLLVDLSGSMSRQNKIRAAVLAASVSAQALRELGVPTAVVGFQDTLIPLADFDEPWSVELERRLASMNLEAIGKRPGGHNRPDANYDGPCLEKAARLLRQQLAAQHILVVFSDGEPTGSHGHDKLRAAVADVVASRQICLVGLGLGRGTAHVARFYPDAKANIAVSDFPQVLTATLVRRLRTARLAG